MINAIRRLRRHTTPNQHQHIITFYRTSHSHTAPSTCLINSLRAVIGKRMDGNQLSTNVSHPASLSATHRTLILHRIPPFLIAIFNTESHWRSCAKPNNFHFAPHTLPTTWRDIASANCCGSSLNPFHLALMFLYCRAFNTQS